MKNQKIRWSFYAVLVGILSGLAASVFLISLSFATAYRETHPNLVLGLPLAGFAIGLIYHYFGNDIAPGTSLILDQIKSPSTITPVRMAPVILFTTLLTHLFGGSAGREGTAVQMGASLSDQLSRFFPIENLERRILLVAGIGAGFGAALGTPFAGIFFGMEIMRQGRLKLFSFLECLIASFVAVGVTHILHAPHTQFPVPQVLFTFPHSGLALVSSLMFALIARAFLWTTHGIESTFNRLIAYPPFKPLIGGALLLVCFEVFKLQMYEGLGLDILLKAFDSPLPASVFILKLLLTSLTLGSGFKGGEFIPLIFAGAASASFLAGMTHLDPSMFAAIGCVALFAAASKTPFTSSIMAIELFGWQIAPYAFVVCYLSSALSGSKTIYRKHSA
jgi:H+/Cl- antiporter ClcA